MLSKRFAFSGYVINLDIYDVIKYYLKENKDRLYRQNGSRWLKEGNAASR